MKYEIKFQINHQKESVSQLNLEVFFLNTFGLFRLKKVSKLQ